MNDNFWNEWQATQHLQTGLAAALRGEYVKLPAGADPLLTRIDRVCEEVQREHPQRHLAKSLINPYLSRSPEVNARKVALAEEFGALLHDLAAPAGLVTDVLNLYGLQPPPSENTAARGFVDTAAVIPPVAEVRTVQQVVGDHRRPELTVPAGSPIEAHLQAWAALRDRLHDLYADLDELSASEAYALRQENAEAVDALLAEEAFEQSWDGETLTEVLTLHDLRSGDVQVLQLTGLQVEGANWTVQFADMTQPPPLLGTGEILRLVTRDGTQADDIPHHDLEFRDGMLLVVGVEPEYLETLRHLSISDIQQLALLHYGHSL